MLKRSMYEEAAQVTRQYKDCLSYLAPYLKNWKLYFDFKEGRQWPQATAKTASMPRPVINVIEFVVNHKVASVANQNIKLLYTVPEIGQDLKNITGLSDEVYSRATDAATLFTELGQMAWENMKKDMVNAEVLETAAVCGTGVWHYFWDETITGGLKTRFKGDLAVESVSPSNVFFGNPQETNVQNQPYILITKRELVDNVKKRARANGLKEADLLNIVPDEADDNSEKRVVNGTQKVTLITKYWKEGGRVYYCQVAGNVLVTKKRDTNLTLYPVVSIRWKNKEKNIYGIGDVAALISNQKAINSTFGMALFSVHLAGWPKAVVNPQYVKQAKITNTVGEIIEDSSQDGRGFRYEQPAPLSGYVQSLVNTLIEYTKTFSSANDAATGSITASGQFNAAAIKLIQDASDVPIISIRKRYYQALEDMGRIEEQFFRNYYVTARTIKVKNEDGTYSLKEFRGDEYFDIPLKFKIEVGAAGSYSEQLTQEFLEKFLQEGLIDFETYLKLSSKSIIPFKDSILKDLKAKQEQQAQAAQKEQAQQAPPQQQGQAGPMPQNAPSPQNVNPVSFLSPQEQAVFYSLPPEQQNMLLSSVS